MGKTRGLFKKFGDKGSIKWRDNKVFLSDQCKEIEENNRMGKTRDIFKNIRDTKDYFMQRWGQ